MNTNSRLKAAIHWHCWLGKLPHAAFAVTPATNATTTTTWRITRYESFTLVTLLVTLFFISHGYVGNVDGSFLITTRTERGWVDFFLGGGGLLAWCIISLVAQTRCLLGRQNYWDSLITIILGYKNGLLCKKSMLMSSRRTWDGWLDRWLWMVCGWWCGFPLPSKVSRKSSFPSK